MRNNLIPIIFLHTKFNDNANSINLPYFSYKSNPPTEDIEKANFFNSCFTPSSKIQEADINALAQVVGKDKAEKVFLVVRGKMRMRREGKVRFRRMD